MRLDEDELLAEARQLLGRIDRGAVTTSAYDTAWVARLRRPGDPRTPRFPRSIAWLLTNQRDDGSWGPSVELLHDRMTNTLAGVLTLVELSRDGIVEPDEAGHRVARGIRYVAGHAARLRDEVDDLIAFELVFPALLERSAAVGLDLPFGEFAWLEELRQQKLRLLPRSLIYDPTVSVGFSLEFLGDGVDVACLPRLQAEHGSIATSPSATAFALARREDPAAVRYLEEAMSSDGGVAAVFPFDVFERAWALDSLQSAGVRLPEMESHVAYLRRVWRETGVGWASDGVPPDADDTSMVVKVLRRAGVPIDGGSALRRFEAEDGYRALRFERNPAVSANVHVLGALRETPDAHAAQIRRVVAFLAARREQGAFWRDKWHISPFYATGHGVQVLAGADEGLREDSARWLLQIQHGDGSWGIGRGSCEETAYALGGLMTMGGEIGRAAGGSIRRGVEYLLANRHREPPPLWVAKVLYCPKHVVQAAVLGALLRFARHPLAK